MSKPIKAYLSLTLAMVIVGSSVVAGKIMVAELPVYGASLLRFAVASIILLPLVRFMEGGLPRLSLRSWGLLCAQSLCGSVLFTVFLLHGLQYTGAASAGVITATTPACMALTGWALLAHRPSRRAVGGILLAGCGVAVINVFGAGSLATGAKPLLGNGLVFCAVICESLFLLLRKSVHESLSPLAASTILSLFGVAWFLPVGAWELATLDLSAVGSAGWWTVAYYGAAVTVLAYVFWFAGVTRVNPSTAGVFSTVMPVSALLLSAAFLGEPVGLAHMAGCALALGGILVMTAHRADRPS